MMPISEAALQIVLDIEQGKKIDTAQISWSDINQEGKDYLFEQAHKRWGDDRKGVELLQGIYRISGNDVPDRIKVLQLVYLRRDTSTEKKKNIIENIKMELDKLRASSVDVELFNVYSGDYHLLIARDKGDSGNIERTLAEYQNAIGYYQKTSLKDRISQIEQEVEKIIENKEQKNKPLPIELLISQRSQIVSELSQVSEQLATVKLKLQKAEDIQSELEKKQKSMEKASQVKSLELEKLKTEIEQLKQRYPSAREALEFMMILPQATTAPLWVEVLQIALQQGEIDDLCIQALERLSIPYPKEAIPIIVEIAARAPDPFKIEKKQAQAGIGQWFNLIAQARQEMQTESYLQAAKLMVQAWDIFFQLGIRK